MSPTSETCWDCHHPIDEHSGEYAGWDRRNVDGFSAAKKPGTGCLVEGCNCRRWFEPEDQ